MKSVKIRLGDTIADGLRELAEREGRSVNAQLVHMIKHATKWVPQEYTCETGHVTRGPANGDAPPCCPTCVQNAALNGHGRPRGAGAS
jgi:hypothetical protein